MADKFSLPSWSARNPLGIIALFISLIYAMSAALLGASVRSLTESNQTVLVVFIVSFPFVVLFVFAWLVARHHSKLYSPGDYRTDEGFLSAASPLPPSELGQRLREEIRAQNESAASDGSNQTTIDKKGTDEGGEVPGATDSRVLQAYVAENLAFQELQSEFGGSLRRHVSIRAPERDFQLDGMIESDGKTIIVEVKSAYAASSVKVIAERARNQFTPLVDIWMARPDIRFLLAVILYGGAPRARREEISTQAKTILGDRFDIRIYSFDELSRKYGLTKPTTRLGKID